MNLYDYTAPKVGEKFDTLLQHKGIKIVRIVSSDSADHKVYMQDEDEWIVVIDGKATLELESQMIKLHKGDTLLIPAKTPHRVIETLSGTLWLAIHIDDQSSGVTIA